MAIFVSIAKPNWRKYFVFNWSQISSSICQNISYIMPKIKLIIRSETTRENASILKPFSNNNNNKVTNLLTFFVEQPRHLNTIKLLGNSTFYLKNKTKSYDYTPYSAFIVSK